MIFGQTLLISTKVCSRLQCSWWEKLKLDWVIRTLKKSAKFKLFKDFQFYSRFSSLLISRSYLIPTVQEACAKYFAVQKSKIEIFQITWKRWNKEHQTHSFQFFTNVFIILTFLVLFFMWYTRFQISISELQSIWRKLPVLGWL